MTTATASRIEQHTDPDFRRPGERGGPAYCSGVRVRDVMSPGVSMVGPDASVANALARMRAAGSDWLLVADGSLLRGGLSAAQARQAMSEGPGGDEVPVRDVMTAGVSVCDPDLDLAPAVALMRERAVNHLLVIARDGRPVGVLTRAAGAARVPDPVVAQPGDGNRVPPSSPAGVEPALNEDAAAA